MVLPPPPGPGRPPNPHSKIKERLPNKRIRAYVNTRTAKDK